MPIMPRSPRHCRSSSPAPAPPLSPLRRPRCLPVPLVRVTAKRLPPPGARRHTNGLSAPASLPSLHLMRSPGRVRAPPPPPAGTFSFLVQVTDSAKTSATGTVSLTINNPPLNITTLAPIFSGTAGVPYVQTFRASGGNPPYTWTIVSGNPGGMILNPSTGDLQGTPQTAGTFNFTVQAADRLGATATQSFSLVFNPPTLAVTVASSLPAGTVGVPYNQKLPVVANGGTPPYTWSLIAGSVPGLSLDRK